MFDEENSDIAKWREELLEIERSSQDVAERDERVLAYLIQYSEEVSKQKKTNQIRNIV